MAGLADAVARRGSEQRYGVTAWGLPLVFLLALVVVAIILRISDPLRLSAARNFVVIFSSLLIGAMPLIVLGALVAAAIAVFVPAAAFERIGHLPAAMQLPAAGICGFALPICECGSVPVARRLMLRGLSPPAAITFMVAAPILNPIVILSTVIAYRGRDTMWAIVGGRVGLGLVAAVAVGWVIGALRNEEILAALGNPEVDGPSERHLDEDLCDCGDSHHHDHESRLSRFFSALAADVVFMGRFLIIGAAVAALLQTAVPQSVLNSVAGTPVVDLVALMGLAFVLSLCSESDAFVAASFVQFGAGAQLAFLVFGPMVDAKLAFLYSATFTKKLFLVVAATAAVVTVCGTLWFEVLIG